MSCRGMEASGLTLWSRIRLSPMRICCFRLFLFAALVLPAFSVRVGRAETPSGVAGPWRGQSVCVTGAPACHNETVVYYIKEIPDRPDQVLIQADKIVDGKAITMGAGPWQYDRARHTLEWRLPQRVWFMKITGDRMEGTLTLADKTVFRTMTLEKDK